MTANNNIAGYPSIGIFHSPLGPIALGANQAGLGFCIFLRKQAPVLSYYRHNEGKVPSVHLELALKFLEVYFSGTPVDIADYISKGLVFDLDHFTGREKQVYDALLGVPWGETISYRDLAARAGSPNGARFIGNAMAKNRFPVLIPCHRVIKSDGKHGQYTGGADKKEYLLKLENPDKIIKKNT